MSEKNVPNQRPVSLDSQINKLSEKKIPLSWVKKIFLDKMVTKNPREWKIWVDKRLRWWLILMFRNNQANNYNSIHQSTAIYNDLGEKCQTNLWFVTLSWVKHVCRQANVLVLTVLSPFSFIKMCSYHFFS